MSTILLITAMAIAEAIRPGIPWPKKLVYGGFAWAILFDAALILAYTMSWAR